MNKYICGDCGCKEGENHKDMCDIERCPKCSKQLISCDCKFPSIDEDTLTDNKGNEFERILVKSSLEEDFGE